MHKIRKYRRKKSNKKTDELGRKYKLLLFYSKHSSKLISVKSKYQLKRKQSANKITPRMLKNKRRYRTLLHTRAKGQIKFKYLVQMTKNCKRSVTRLDNRDEENGIKKRVKTTIALKNRS